MSDDWIVLRGYAHVYGDQADDRAARFAAGCFNWRRLRLLYQHEKQCESYAHTDDGTLHAWQDWLGLGFSAALSLTPATARLVRMIRAGVTGMSIGPQYGVKLDGSVVIKCSISELSYTPNPAFPCGGVWVAADEDVLPPRLASLAYHHRQGTPR